MASHVMLLSGSVQRIAVCVASYTCGRLSCLPVSFLTTIVSYCIVVSLCVSAVMEVNQNSENMEPVPESTKPVPENTNPVPENMKPVPENTKSVPDNMKPVPENMKPVPEDTKLAPENTKSMPENMKPAPEDTKPAPENTKPVPENTKPVPENMKPVPETSTSSAAESDSTEDKELQEEIAQWKQRLTTLKNNENFKDKVTNAEPIEYASFFPDFFPALPTVLSQLMNALISPGLYLSYLVGVTGQCISVLQQTSNLLQSQNMVVHIHQIKVIDPPMMLLEFVRGSAILRGS